MRGCPRRRAMRPPPPRPFRPTGWCVGRRPCHTGNAEMVRCSPPRRRLTAGNVGAIASFMQDISFGICAQCRSPILTVDVSRRHRASSARPRPCGSWHPAHPRRSRCRAGNAGKTENREPPSVRSPGRRRRRRAAPRCGPGLGPRAADMRSVACRVQRSGCVGGGPSTDEVSGPAPSASIVCLRHGHQSSRSASSSRGASAATNWARSIASSLTATAGFSLRYWRAFSLP